MQSSMEPSEKQKLIYEWLKKDLNLPTYAEVYYGAVLQLIQTPLGFVTFVSHAGRDIMNGIAKTTKGISRKQTEYKSVLDSIQCDWPYDLHDEMQVQYENRKGFLIGKKIYKSLNKLIKSHNEGRVRKTDADDIFFQEFLDYMDKDRVPPNFRKEWASTKDWFFKHTHLNTGSFGENERRECIDNFRTLEDFLYIAASSQFERLKSLRQVIECQETLKTEIIPTIKTQTDRQYFFSRLKNPLWLQPLRERGAFENPPAPKHLPNGMVQYPHWPELQYLSNIATQAPAEAIEILLAIPKTENPRVYDGILDIALKLSGNDSVQLYPKLKEYAESNYLFWALHLPDLLQHWTQAGQELKPIEFAEILIQFQPDSKAKEKERNRKKNPEAYGTSLEPLPKFRDYEYEQILSKGVRPLAEKSPLHVSRILIDAVSRMIRLEVHNDEFEKRQPQDFSEIWMPRLNESNNHYKTHQTHLVETLTFACEKVFESGENIRTLDQILQNQTWKVFQRLRQYLFAKYPVAEIKESIHDLILGYQDYSRFEFGYEFQQMVKAWIVAFGNKLLASEEVEEIFQKILLGPSLQDFHERLGAEYSEEKYLRRQRLFHIKQLLPFKSLLNPEQVAYLNGLIAQVPELEIKDEDYAPYATSQGGFVSTQSPKNKEELKRLSDSDLLQFINEWDNPHQDKDNWLIEINHSGLVNEFQTVFETSIFPDPRRFHFWLASREQIARPIFVDSIVMVFIKAIKDKQLVLLPEIFDFCNWVVSHTENDSAEEDSKKSDESKENPDWSRACRSVMDLVEACVKEESQIPIDNRKAILHFLQEFCIQFDPFLDHGKRVITNHFNAVMEGINTTRGRALECLIQYGLWVRRAQENANLDDIEKILNSRINNADAPKLTIPEKALLASNLGRLFHLIPNWVKENKTHIFPMSNEDAWCASFDAFIRFNGPHSTTFALLKEDYKESLQRLVQFTSKHEEFVRRIGQHLFALYLWDAFPLRGTDSLIENYLSNTKDNKSVWGQLFDHIGRTLRSVTNLNDKIKERLIEYFNWRFNEKEPEELKHFKYWLDAKCLDPQWLLDSYKAILDLGISKDHDLHFELKQLNQLLPTHMMSVLECFHKITEQLNQSNSFYLSEDLARPILEAGLKSSQQDIKECAEKSRENLLKLGRFEFMDVIS